MATALEQRLLRQQAEVYADALMSTYKNKLTKARARLVVATALHVGADPMHLGEVINFESRFNPRAQYGDPAGTASFDPELATGLIQFIPRSAIALGTTTAALRRMSFEQQMPYVLRYLEAVRAGEWPRGGGPGPLDTRHRLAMAVFYPLYRYWPLDKLFPDVVRDSNPGFTTPRVYIAAMLRTRGHTRAPSKTRPAATNNTGLVLGGLALLALLGLAAASRR